MTCPTVYLRFRALHVQRRHRTDLALAHVIRRVGLHLQNVGPGGTNARMTHWGRHQNDVAVWETRIKHLQTEGYPSHKSGVVHCLRQVLARDEIFVLANTFHEYDVRLGLSRREDSVRRHADANDMDTRQGLRMTAFRRFDALSNTHLHHGQQLGYDPLAPLLQRAARTDCGPLAHPTLPNEIPIPDYFGKHPPHRHGCE